MMQVFKILIAGLLTACFALPAFAASFIPQSTTSFNVEFQWSGTPFTNETVVVPMGYDYTLSLVSYFGSGSDQSGYYFDVDGIRLTNSNTSACVSGFGGNCDLIGASTAPGALFENLTAGTSWQLGVYESETPTFGKVTFNISKVAVVPVPAAGFLLLGALAGCAALRKRKPAT